MTDAEEHVLAVLNRVVRAAAAQALPPERAEALADAVVNRLCDELGGLQVYIPRRAAARRAAAVREDWRAGFSVRSIARRHGLSESAVYRILDRDTPSLFSLTRERSAP